MEGRGGPAIGATVVTADGTTLGRVKAVSADGAVFRVDCPHAPDLYIPAAFVARSTDTTATLAATDQQAKYLGWELKPSDWRE